MNRIEYLLMKSLAIIIPAYKNTYLHAALDSISKQTSKDFTVYIGDDCSPYDLKSIVEEFSDKIDIVYHRFETNIGGTDLVAQWERCIALSTDEPYIWLFSDDDIMQHQCVESFLRLPLSIKDNYIVHFDISIIDEFSEGKIVDVKNYPLCLTAKEYLDKKLKGELISFVVEFIFPRKVYNRANGFQNYDLAWGSDFMTWLKFAGICNGIYSVVAENARVLWRKSNENISPDKSYPILIRKFNSLIENAAYIKYFLSKNGFKPTFMYSKFVWGEILRNRTYLTTVDIHKLGRDFRKKVGYYLYSFIAQWYCIIRVLCKNNRL